MLFSLCIIAVKLLKGEDIQLYQVMEKPKVANAKASWGLYAIGIRAVLLVFM